MSLSYYNSLQFALGVHTMPILSSFFLFSPEAIHCSADRGQPGRRVTESRSQQTAATTMATRRVKSIEPSLLF